MPAKSKAELRYLFANKPAVAKEMAAKTPNIKKLPERVHPAVKQAIDSFKKYNGGGRKSKG